MSARETNRANSVSKRVQQTKEEIEELKLELQKLISNGLEVQTHLRNNDISENKINKFEHKSTSNIENNKNVSHRSRSQTRLDIIAQKPKPCSSKNVTKKETISPKKIRSYDPADAREYIRKQKEKRLAEQKIKKDEILTGEDKKLRLKELHKKSIQLVTKNVQLKRERSQSRERKEVPYENNSTFNRIPDLIPNSNERVGNNNTNNVHFKLKKELHPNLTCRRKISATILPEATIPLDQSTYRVDDLKHKAAIRIQAVYRGYKQRKLYKSILLKNKLEQEAALPEYHQEVQQKNIKIVPEWLQYNSTPSNPYNFINTVKRKLNLGIKTGKTEFNVDQNNVTKAKQEIKQLLEESIKSSKSFLSHKHNVLNELPKQLLSKTKSKTPSHNLEKLSDSDTSKNIPDLTSESTSSKKLNSHHSKSSSTKKSSLSLQTEEIKENIGSTKSTRNDTSRKSSKSNKKRKSNSNSIEEISSIFSNDSIIASNKCSTNASLVSNNTKLNTITDTSLKPPSPPVYFTSFFEYMNTYDKTPVAPKLTDPDDNFYSLPTSTVETNNQIVQSKVETIATLKSHSEINTINTSSNCKYSSNFTNTDSPVPSLIRPSISLHTSHDLKSNLETKPPATILKQGEKTTVESIVSKLFKSN